MQEAMEKMNLGDIVQVFNFQQDKWNYHTTIHDASDKFLAAELVQRQGNLRYRVVRYTVGKDVEPDLILG